MPQNTSTFYRQNLQNPLTPEYTHSSQLQKDIQTAEEGWACVWAVCGQLLPIGQPQWPSTALPRAGLDSPAGDAGLTSSATDPCRPELLSHETLQTQLSSGLGISSLYDQICPRSCSHSLATFSLMSPSDFIKIWHFFLEKSSQLQKEPFLTAEGKKKLNVPKAQTVPTKRLSIPEKKRTL